jgi:DNA polymerase III epsilon subunit-like protein
MKQFEPKKKLHKRAKHEVRKANKVARAKQTARQRERDAINKLSNINDRLNESKKFVSLDFEAFERNQKKITEVGFSVFENNKFTHYHYIIKENIKCLNGVFVPNNKFNFAFGESEILTLEEAFGRLREVLATTDYLIGHGVNNELKWLRQNDIKLHCNLNLIDTGKLGGGIMHVGKRASLTRVLDFLGIEHDLLHNAGNDSFYTMKALWHMVVRVAA